MPQQRHVNLKTFAFPGCHADISGRGRKRDPESIKLPLFKSKYKIWMTDTKDSSLLAF